MLISLINSKFRNSKGKGMKRLSKCLDVDRRRKHGRRSVGVLISKSI